MRLLSLAIGFVMLFALVPAGHGADASPGFKNIHEQDEKLLALLKSRKYEELDAHLDDLLKRYEKDRSLERAVDLALDTFYRAGPELEPLLTGWIAQKPDSHVAYLARAQHYTRVGWARRGTLYFRDTPEKQIDGMIYNFKKAISDLNQALTLNPRSEPAICNMMDILMAVSARDQIRALRDKALEINPLSLSVRSCYMSSILPRWGGSIPQMSKEIEEARAYYDQNPALRILEGRIAADLGDQALFAGNYGRAVELYTEALKHGSHHFLLRQRAEAHMRGGNFVLALKDLDGSIAARPNNSPALYLRGYIRNESRLHKYAVVDLTKALEINPYHDRSWFIRGDVYLQLGNPDLAIADLEKALALNPGEREYQEVMKEARAAKAGKK